MDTSQREEQKKKMMQSCTIILQYTAFLTDFSRLLRLSLSISFLGCCYCCIKSVSSSLEHSSSSGIEKSFIKTTSEEEIQMRAEQSPQQECGRIVVALQHTKNFSSCCYALSSKLIFYVCYFRTFYFTAVRKGFPLGHFAKIGGNG